MTMSANNAPTFSFWNLFSNETPFAATIKAKTEDFSPGWHIAIALMINILALAVPIMMLQVYDRIIPHQAYGTLVVLVSGVMVALLFDMMLRMARAYLMSWSASSHEHAASQTAIDHFLRADLPSFERHTPGTHLQNLSALGRLREFYSGQALTALVDMPFVFLFLGLIAYLGHALVLVPIVLLLTFFLVARAVGQNLKRALEMRREDDDKKAGFIVAALTGMHTAKAMGMESLLLRQFESFQQKTTNDSYHVARASGAANMLSAAFGQLSLIVTATVGSLFVLNGSLSVGGLSACVLLSGRAIQPVQRVLGTWLRTQELSIAQSQAAELFALPIQAREATAMSAPRGKVALDKVSFHIEDQVLLDQASLEIEPGSTIAISGAKGSGKSTLLQLIAGVLTPTSGRVVIDGMNPTEYSMSDLAAHVGYLPQWGTIFKGTILENLTGFRTDDASITAAKEAAHDLKLDEVVHLLARGYQTMLNDNAADPVPPGVKQRIALTRVLMHRPKIVLFDDADRTLDKEGYNQLFRVMGRLKGTCTMIIVSHDQNLLSLADRSYYLSNGQLKLAGQNTIHAAAFFQGTEGGR